MSELRDIDEVRLIDPAVARDPRAKVGLPRHVSSRPRRVESIPLAWRERAAEKEEEERRRDSGDPGVYFTDF